MFGLKHERLFDCNRRSIKGIEGDPAEASWMAAPFLHQLDRDIPVVHLVRHPLDVVKSMCAHEFWVAVRHKQYRDFVLAFLPKLEGLEPVVASAVYWLEWNKMVDGRPRIRLESIACAPRLNKGPRLPRMPWLPERINRRVMNKAVDYGYAPWS